MLVSRFSSVEFSGLAKLSASTLFEKRLKSSPNYQLYNVDRAEPRAVSHCELFFSLRMIRPYTASSSSSSHRFRPTCAPIPPLLFWPYAQLFLWALASIDQAQNQASLLLSRCHHTTTDVNSTQLFSNTRSLVHLRISALGFVCCAGSPVWRCCVRVFSFVHLRGIGGNRSQRYRLSHHQVSSFVQLQFVGRRVNSLRRTREQARVRVDFVYCFFCVV